MRKLEMNLAGGYHTVCEEETCEVLLEINTI